MTLKITEIFKVDANTKIKLPLFFDNVKAGFPSPASNYVESRIDLNEQLIKHPSSTFLLRVQGDSMIDVGIFSGDILIVDRSLPLTNDNIVIASLNGDFTVKRIKLSENKVYLVAENPDYKDIEVTGESELMVWGTVIHSIHSFNIRH